MTPEEEAQLKAKNLQDYKTGLGTNTNTITKPNTTIGIGNVTTGSGSGSTSTTAGSLVSNSQLKVPDLNKNFSLFKNPASGLNKAQSNFESVMKGKDFTSQRLTNQFMEANAAQSAAAKGAAAQQAALSGATANSQSLLNRMTQRDIEGQRQQGMNELSATLGQRADQAAGQLAQIGEYKSNYEMQAKQQENQAKLNEVALGINLKELEMKVDSVEKAESLKKFEAVLSSADLTTDEGLQKALKAGKEAGIDLDWNALKMKQWDLKEQKANSELLTYVNANISNFKGLDNSYDPKKAVEDPKVRKMLLDLWDAENNGTMDLVPKDADGNPDWSKLDESGMNWIKNKLSTAMITDKEQAANDYIASMNVVKNTDIYKNMTTGQKTDFDKMVAETAALIQTGIKMEVVDGQVIFKDSATGTMIGSGAVWDKQGGKYFKNNTGGISLTNKDGTTTSYKLIKNEKGEETWVKDGSFTVVKIDKVANADLTDMKPGDVIYETSKEKFVVGNDGETIVVGSSSGKGGHIVLHKDPATGKFSTKTFGDTKVTDEEKAYLDRVNGKKVDAELGTLGVKIPAGIQSGGGFVQNGKYYISNGDSAEEIRFNSPTSSNIGAILDIAKDKNAKSYVETALKKVNFALDSDTAERVANLVWDGTIDISKATPLQNAKVGIYVMDPATNWITKADGSQWGAVKGITSDDYSKLIVIGGNPYKIVKKAMVDGVEAVVIQGKNGKQHVIRKNKAGGESDTILLNEEYTGG